MTVKDLIDMLETVPEDYEMEFFNSWVDDYTTSYIDEVAVCPDHKKKRVRLQTQ